MGHFLSTFGLEKCKPLFGIKRKKSCLSLSLLLLSSDAISVIYNTHSDYYI